jgi:hypothetical protein
VSDTQMLQYGSNAVQIDANSVQPVPLTVISTRQ